jgi:hypothetical protein
LTGSESGTTNLSFSFFSSAGFCSSIPVGGVSAVDVVLHAWASSGTDSDTLFSSVFWGFSFWKKRILSIIHYVLTLGLGEQDNTLWDSCM